MFEMGFMELVLVAVIGLLVLGPQRLPKVAAEVGRWIGRARRTATQLRRQLEREIELSEIESPPPPRAPASPTAPASIQPAQEPELPTATDAEAAAHSSEPTIGTPPEASSDATSRDLARESSSTERVDETAKLNS
jgi:sec-independent protein translocase protein TatB